MTDAELARTIRETYERVMARNYGTTELAFRTCEAFLRIHRGSEGTAADRARIARMVLAEELLGSPRGSPAACR
jgi:hypothetical protein